MRECTDLLKAKQPRNLGYMQIAVFKIATGQIASQLVKYLAEVQPVFRKLSGKRPLAHPETTSNVVHVHSSMRKQRRDRVFNSRAQPARITSSLGLRRLAIFKKKSI